VNISQKAHVQHFIISGAYVDALASGADTMLQPVGRSTRMLMKCRGASGLVNSGTGWRGGVERSSGLLLV
jgi:hypothetical protein